jgi:hypothetical protein
LQDELLSVKAFSAWEDVVELIDQGIIMKSTVDLLINEVGASKTQTLTFDQFWKLVNLLEEASDAAADKVAAGMDDEDMDDIDMTPEEEEAMTLEVFNNLKNPKTGLVASKKLKNWGSIAEALDSGEMSKGMLNSAIKKVGAELDFEMFKKLMLLLEEAMEERDEAGDMPAAPVANVSGKGFAKAAEPVAPVAAAAVAQKGKASKAVVSDSESEANIITKEIYEDLRGNVRYSCQHTHVLL